MSDLAVQSVDEFRAGKTRRAGGTPCEGCGAAAFGTDRDGVPLCYSCWEALLDGGSDSPITTSGGKP